MRKLRRLAGTILAGVATAAGAQTAVLTHAELQAVTATGTSAWEESFPFTIRGVVVNDPEEMLDCAYDPEATESNRLGGLYQVFFQAVDAGDRGGTALWMAQNYQALGFPGQDYGAEWTNEMRRVQYDANGRKFRRGDLIEVTARKALFRGGKRNVNEGHRIAPANDFTVALVKANVGLPPAEALSLSALVAADGNQIFDATRATGGEHWQGMRVRLDGLRLATTNGWGQTNWADRLCLAADAAGRTFPLRMPRADLGAPPATSAFFSAVGILNQEDGNTNGYELFVQEIRPALEIGRGAGGAVRLCFPADYAGYTLEYSDDGLGIWQVLDATPRRTIVIEDPAAPTNRAYRLKWTP